MVVGLWRRGDRSPAGSIFFGGVLRVVGFPRHFEPSLDALSLRSDVITSIKILSRQVEALSEAHMEMWSVALQHVLKWR